MKYEIVLTSAFKKDLKKLKKQHKNIHKLKKVIDTLAAGDKLDIKYRDHALNDNDSFKKCRECHIEPDWLLIYRINNKLLTLLLIETGSHSELF